jgi:hypothetical protein
MTRPFSSELAASSAVSRWRRLALSQSRLRFRAIVKIQVESDASGLKEPRVLTTRTKVSWKGPRRRCALRRSGG